MTERTRASYHDIPEVLRPHGIYRTQCQSCTKYSSGTQVFAITENRRLSDPNIATNFALFSIGRRFEVCTKDGITRHCMPLKKDRLPGELRRAVR